jgi:hypothetical protein
MSPEPNISLRGVPSAISRVLQSGRVWAIQGVGTLVWLALAYAAFRIGGASAWRLVCSAVLVIFLTYLGAFLQRTALRVYRRERQSAARPGRQGGKIRHRQFSEWLPDGAFIFVLFVALVGLYGVSKQALHTALWHPEPLEFALLWLFFIVIWLPLEAAVLLGERSMWGAARRAWRRVSFWLETLACVVVIHLVFWTLVQWLQPGKGFRAASPATLGLLALGYALALGAWLLTLAIVEVSISSAEPRSLDDTWD